MKILCIGEALIDMICVDKGKSLSEGNNFLGKEPVNAIYFAATFLLIASALTLRMKNNKPGEDVAIPMGAGH